MIYVACGYSGTGSSAIVHLLSEYENCTIGDLGKYEHLPFYIPDGLFDLEDRLLLNNSIHMADAAIKRFYLAMRRLNDDDYGWFGGYQRKFGNQFMTLVDEFLNDVVEYKLPGYWSDDYSFRFSLPHLFKHSIDLVRGKQVAKYGYKVDRKGDGQVFYSFVTKEKFYEAAHKFVNGYIDMIVGNQSKILVCDQLLLPHNLYRVERYFREDEIKIIVLDRDPRDMFVLSKYVWPRMGSAPLFPTSAEQFTSFYSSLLGSEMKHESNLILRLHFEDLIYQYEDSVHQIEEFLGSDMGKHISKRKVFNPDISIKNTQNFRIDPKWHDEIKLVEERMAGYLYHFPKEFVPNMEETTDP